MSYTPPQEILDKYADLMVNFALWDGKGIKKEDVVSLRIPDSAREFVEPLQKAILKAGGHYILNYRYDNGRTESPTFYEHANDDQIGFYPKDYILEGINTCDHALSVDATSDKHLLDSVDSKKVIKRKEGFKFSMDAFYKKVHEGKASWTLCTYGTEALAKDAGMTLEEYWEQIIKACYLDKDDPVAEWRAIEKKREEIKNWLNSLEIQSVHLTGDDMDLIVAIGDNRQWLGGGGNNIPSYEIFTSPDWRGTNGWIRFNQSLSRYGSIIEGIELKFKDGLVVEATATKGEQLLKDMIAAPNANKVGEFSLTDKRMSRITKPMNDIIFDENMGGEFGNTHIAVGMAYKDAYPGDITAVTEEQWDEMGYNDSAEHTDIISTTDRTVIATLQDGSEKVIYKDGMFQLDA